jgi:hypothetical protein
MSIADHLGPPSSTPAFVLGLRNFTYLGVVIWLGVMLYKRIDKVNDTLSNSNLRI